MRHSNLNHHATEKVLLQSYHHLKDYMEDHYAPETVHAYELSVRPGNNASYQKLMHTYKELELLYQDFSQHKNDVEILDLYGYFSEVDSTLPGVRLYYEKIHQSLCQLKKIPIDDKPLPLSQAQGILTQELAAIEQAISDYFFIRLNVLSEEKLYNKSHFEKTLTTKPLELLDDFNYYHNGTVTSESRIEHLQTMTLQILYRYCQAQENKAKTLAKTQLYKAFMLLQIEREILGYYEETPETADMIKALVQEKHISLNALEDSLRTKKPPRKFLF